MYQSSPADCCTAAPTSAICTMLVAQLLFEGKHTEARDVLDEEMPLAHVMPTHRTHALFEKPDEQWSAMRAKHMQGLFKRKTDKATKQAHALFAKLKANGATDVFLWNVRLQQCGTIVARVQAGEA